MSQAGHVNALILPINIDILAQPTTPILPPGTLQFGQSPLPISPAPINLNLKPVQQQGQPTPQPAAFTVTSAHVMPACRRGMAPVFDGDPLNLRQFFDEIDSLATGMNLRDSEKIQHTL